MTRATAVFLCVQLAFAMLTLGFGVLALRVAPRPERSARLGAWYLTGAGFATIGVLATVSNALAFPAVLAGRDAPFYAWFNRYSTVSNDARGFAVFGLALALVHTMRRPRP